ncbi:hypothetical protein QMK19_40580 [Streptomyces sp. H10-C2]|uniref:hypothetical protein n=1 Tax=unclassified Streptomyces TaxID=2593676 RepID=UPI0024B89909|nr:MULTISPECIES: hypothetical protein [unclassified Streptomyces]MDJ0347402.1 hypothetical protein [Streptomyces sp. PH10-H1]MDJ0375702.1 hypothetical protein [Streptomyces sp. H10-C2]
MSRRTHQVPPRILNVRAERVLLTYDQVVHDYELPATEGKRGHPRWPTFARRYAFDIEQQRPPWLPSCGAGVRRADDVLTLHGRLGGLGEVHDDPFRTGGDF